jgi:SAM-dependent methyltransferase
MTTRRLNLGCGPTASPGWINLDRRCAPGVDVLADVALGLPFRDESVDIVVASHVLQDLSYRDVPAVLDEIRRVLKPAGVLRLGLPDLERAIRAWIDNDRRYFYIPDEDATSIGGKLCLQVSWYGSVRTPFTWDFVEELAYRAGFRSVKRCAFGETASHWPEIVALDNRERETLFVEAVR